MTVKEIQDWHKQYVKGPKLDILVVDHTLVIDYASLYPTTMKKFNITLKHLRNMNRKKSIKSIYEPSE